MFLFPLPGEMIQINQYFFSWVETTNKFVIYPREGIPTYGNLGVRLGNLASLQANRVGCCNLNGSQNS